MAGSFSRCTQDLDVLEDAQTPPPSDWAALPFELLSPTLGAAKRAAAPGPPSVGGTAGASCYPQQGSLPSLAEAARLCFAIEACCRSWRDASVGLPLQLAIGSSPLSGADVTGALKRWLHTRPLERLHFQPAQLPGCRPATIQQLAIDVLASEEFQEASGTTLAELAIFEYISSRTLCSLLPRFPGLRRLALTGYSIDLDLEPLGLLPHLESLHLEAESLPRLDPLPPSLRHLSLSCFANAARVSLPRHLRLDTLVCRCPLQFVYFALARSLGQCSSITISARAVRLLLHVDTPGALGAASDGEGAGALLLQAFEQQACQQLQVEAPPQLLAVRVVLRGAAADVAPALPGLQGREALRTLSPSGVCQQAKSMHPALSAVVTHSHAVPAGGVSGRQLQPMEGILLQKTGPAVMLAAHAVQ